VITAKQPPSIQRKVPLHEESNADSATRQVKDGNLEALAALPAVHNLDRTVALIQALIPLGLHAVADALDAEVTALPGSGTAGQVGSKVWCGGAASRAPSTSRIRNCQSRTRACGFCQAVRKLHSRPTSACGPPGLRMPGCSAKCCSAELPQLCGLCRGRTGSLWAQCVQWIPPVHPSERPTSADLV
jgi:hypothetical protein